MPSGPFSAPLDLGIIYRLVFATAGERLPEGYAANLDELDAVPALNC